jgi:prevent-host-death family protein
MPQLLYRLMVSGVYDWDMDVPVTELRAHLSQWLERARSGDEVVITDRGVPVARLLGLTTAATLERLAADGVIGRPSAARRPRASGRSRPRSRRPLADIVSEQRR